MAKLLYVLLQNTNSDPISWEESDYINFKALKESLMNPSSLGHPNDQIPFSLFVYEKEGNTHGILTQNMGTIIDPQHIIARHGPCVMEIPPCLRAITAIDLLVKATKKIIVDSL